MKWEHQKADQKAKREDQRKKSLLDLEKLLFPNSVHSDEEYKQIPEA